MNLKNYYYYFKSVLPPKLCEDIINYGKSHNSQMAVTGGGDDKNSHGKIRKLSVTISLNDPDEYDGGNLEFDFRNQIDWEKNKKARIKSCAEIRPRGSVIVFPSFCWHRVAPVTRGTRYSLVIWNLGYPFR